MTSVVGNLSNEDLDGGMSGLVGALAKVNARWLPFDISRSFGVQRVWGSTEAQIERLALLQLHDSSG